MVSSLLEKRINGYIPLLWGRIHAKGVTREEYYSGRKLSAQMADSARER
jgi:hypothetical protein